MYNVNETLLKNTSHPSSSEMSINGKTLLPIHATSITSPAISSLSNTLMINNTNDTNLTYQSHHIGSLIINNNSLLNYYGPIHYGAMFARHNNLPINNVVCVPQLTNSNALLQEWHYLLFGSSIFLTAIITFLLNFFVIITLVINGRYACQQQRKFLMSNQKNCNLSTSIISSPSIPSIYRTTYVVNTFPNHAALKNNHYHGTYRDSNGSGSGFSVATSIQQKRALTTSYSNTHQSFISLSISVILYSSICVPVIYLETIDSPLISAFSMFSNCFVIKALKFCFYVSPIASSFMHLLMAFDRYLAIKQCFSFQTFWYRRHYTLCIIFLWIISISFVVPFLWYNEYGRPMQITLTLFRLVFTFSIPSLLTLALYVSIAYELDRVRKQSKSITTFKKNNKIIVKHKNIITKIIMLASVHFLCWFPFSVVQSLNDICPQVLYHCDDSKNVQTYYFIMAILMLITSMSGIAYPILYCFVFNEFRKIFPCKMEIISLFKLGPTVNTVPDEKSIFYSKHSIMDDISNQPETNESEAVAYEMEKENSSQLSLSPASLELFGII